MSSVIKPCHDLHLSVTRIIQAETTMHSIVGTMSLPCNVKTATCGMS